MAGMRTIALSYQELYGEPANDPFGSSEEGNEDCCRAVYDVWRTTTNPLEVKTLLQNVLADCSRPIGCIVVFVADQDSPSGWLHLLHSFHSFPGEPSQSRDRMQAFCFEGDVRGVDIVTVGFNKHLLTITADVVVPGSAERMLQLLSDEPSHELMGPYTDTSANVRTTKARSMAYLPFPLVAGLLGSNLTARQAYELIIPELINAGMMSVCGRLVEFLTVSLVRPTAERATPLTVQHHLGKSGYVPDTSAISHRREHVLYRDLPALRPSLGGATSDPALLDVARGVWEMVTEARAERNDRANSRALARLPRSVRERLGDAIVDLLLLLWCDDDDEDLPALYHEWAARPRGVSERWVVQQAVDAACATLGAPAFEVTPTQVTAFKKFRFAGASYTDIGAGLLPFSITPADAISPQARAMLAADRVRADAFDLGGDPESGAIAPGEVSRLRNLSGYIPISWMEATSQLHSVSGLMGELMGTTHPTILAYGRFLRQYDRLLTRLESEIDQVYGRRLGPSLVTFHVQLAWRNWLVVQLDANKTVRLDPPAFTQGLNMMEVQNNLMWLPTINNVPALSALRINVRSPAEETLPRSPAPTQDAGGRAPSSVEPAVAARRDPGRQVHNPSRESCFVGNTPLARNVRSKTVSAASADAGSQPPEVTRAGVTGPMCISWHAKGQCFNNCPEWLTMESRVHQRRSGSRRGAC
jgi:hypothetical protein